jgi:hypothetical protein
MPSPTINKPPEQHYRNGQRHAAANDRLLQWPQNGDQMKI